MSISLYDATVGTFLQILPAVSGFLEKGRTHCEAQGIPLSEVVDSRLIADMFPFRFQVVSVVHHSRGAFEGIRKGVFTPSGADESLGYTDLERMVKEAHAEIAALSRAEVDGMAGRDVEFRFRDLTLPFLAEDFLLSFSLPNFYFHASTAYDLLRVRGVPIGKRDFMGRLRLKK